MWGWRGLQWRQAAAAVLRTSRPSTQCCSQQLSEEEGLNLLESREETNNTTECIALAQDSAPTLPDIVHFVTPDLVHSLAWNPQADSTCHF